MDYRKITNKSTKQYQLLHSGCLDYCSDGLIRDSDGYISIAIGKAYGSVGDQLILTLDTGNVINALVTDIKATEDTVKNANQKDDGSMIEFIVDVNKLSSKVLKVGDMSVLKEFKGNIVKVEKVV